MVYQQCGHPCPRTCDTEEDEDCTGGCVEGCFCPSGKVLWNGKCINSSECEGKHMHVFTAVLILYSTIILCMCVAKYHSLCNVAG